MATQLKNDCKQPAPAKTEVPPACALDLELPLLEWARKYLPNHFTKPSSGMHRWLGERLDLLHEQRGTKINLIGPRGSAKSTLATLAFVLRMAVEKRENYIWIVSDTKPQACGHLENIAQELIENELLTDGDPKRFRSRSWRQNRIILNNGVTIEALGTGQRIRGRRRRENRPTLIVADDLQNDRDVESARQRRKARDWFHAALLPAGTPQTNVVHLATALHREAIALDVSRTPGWISRTFQAIVAWPANMDLWQQWEVLYCNMDDPDRLIHAREFFIKHRTELEAGAELLWPELEDLYTLMSLRVESGRTAFEREKQSSPINSGMCEWPEDYFEKHIWFDEWPTHYQVKTMALDPSKGGHDKAGDYSAYAMVCVDRENVVWVQADLERRPTPQMVADGLRLYRDFLPTVFGVEATQYQELLIGEFKAEFRRQALFDVEPAPIESKENKCVRIRRLGSLLSTRRLRFKANCAGTKRLVDQCRDFPLGDHDDGPDALEMAIRLAGQLIHGRGPVDNLGDRIPLSV
jgi:hypothetical protein